MKQIDLVTTMDHGKGHSRVTLDMISRWKLEDGSFTEEEYSATIADAFCAHDTVLIFQNTFKTKMNDDLGLQLKGKGFQILKESGRIILGNQSP